MACEDRSAVSAARQANIDGRLEPARSEERAIDRMGSICRTDNYNALSQAHYTIQAREECGQYTRFRTAASACCAVANESIDLVEEEDAWRCRVSCLERPPDRGFCLA